MLAAHVGAVCLWKRLQSLEQKDKQPQDTEIIISSWTWCKCIYGQRRIFELAGDSPARDAGSPDISSNDPRPRGRTISPLAASNAGRDRVSGLRGLQPGQAAWQVTRIRVALCLLSLRSIPMYTGFVASPFIKTGDPFKQCIGMHL